MAERMETEKKKKGESAEGDSQIDVLSGEMHARRLAARLGLEYIYLEQFEFDP